MRLLLQAGLLMLVLVALSTCSTSKAVVEAAPKSPAGTWETKITGTPMGEINADMVLMKEGDTYSGYVLSGDEKMELKNVRVAENKITADFFSHSYSTEVTVDAVYKPETDTIEGWLMDSFRMTGKRKIAEAKH